MYASHTLIAYPIISRYGLSRLRSVNITIGGTAVTVTLALIILAVIGGMFKGAVDGWFWVFLVEIMKLILLKEEMSKFSTVQMYYIIHIVLLLLKFKSS